MIAFTIKAGTKARALRDSGNGVRIEEVTLKADAMYFAEDVLLDPSRATLQDLAGPTILASHGRLGYMAFRLPANSRGFSTLFVNVMAVEAR